MGHTAASNSFVGDRTSGAQRGCLSLGAVLVAVLLAGCGVLDPYGCVTERRSLEARADVPLPTSDSIQNGRFSFFLLQSRGRHQSVGLTYGFQLGPLQESVVSALVRAGEAGGGGRVLLEFPTYPEPGGGPERVYSGLAPSAVPGPVSGPELITTLASGPSHLAIGFGGDAQTTVTTDLVVDDLTEWDDSCT